MNYHSSLDHTTEAIDLYRLYLTRWPDDVGVRYGFGTFLRNAGRVDDAIEQFRQAIRVAPDMARAHVNLATSYHMKGQFRDALTSWEHAFKVEPAWVTNGNLNHEYGVTLVANGLLPRAREVFDL